MTLIAVTPGPVANGDNGTPGTRARALARLTHRSTTACGGRLGISTTILREP